MKIIRADKLTEEQMQDVFKLWNEEFPQKLNYTDLQQFENDLNSLADKKYYLLVDDIESVWGCLYVFTREKERWFSIILSHICQGKGYGTQLLNELKKDEPSLQGWVIDHNNDIKGDGSKYLSPLVFYMKNGFTIVSNTRLDLEKLSAVKIMWRMKY